MSVFVYLCICVHTYCRETEDVYKTMKKWMFRQLLILEKPLTEMMRRCVLWSGYYAKSVTVVGSFCVLCIHSFQTVIQNSLSCISFWCAQMYLIFAVKEHTSAKTWFCRCIHYTTLSALSRIALIVSVICFLLDLEWDLGRFLWSPPNLCFPSFAFQKICGGCHSANAEQVQELLTINCFEYRVEGHFFLLLFHWFLIT